MIEKLSYAAGSGYVIEKINELIDALNGYHITHESVYPPPEEKIIGLTFEEALKYFKQGKTIARSSHKQRTHLHMNMIALTGFIDTIRLDDVVAYDWMVVDE